MLLLRILILSMREQMERQEETSTVINNILSRGRIFSYEAQAEYGITAPNGLTLITESGYLMLVKSFTDDLAWDVQRQLVKRYFAQKPVYTMVTYQYPLSAATFESVANLGRLIERVMRTEGACPHEIAMVLKPIFQQAGIEINERFIKVPAYEQLVLDVVAR